MIKLYKRDTCGGLVYHEAWTTDDGVLEHWGIVGSVGEHRIHPAEAAAESNGDPDAPIAVVLAESRAQGFAELPDDSHHTLVIEYELSSDDPRQIERREALEGDLDEFLGWTGLGCCEGGDTDDGTLEVFCRVVDFDVAAKAIAAEVADTDYGEFRRIYQLVGGE